jgi:hypothetical protein
MTKKYSFHEEGVSSLIAYIMITSVLITMMIILMLVINTTIMERPVTNLLDRSFVDIGNGVSTRMVEVYMISPTESGAITTSFDIPDDVAGRGYLVEINSAPLDDPSAWGTDTLSVSGSSVKKTISLSGIGASLRYGVYGSTTGSGMNRIRYCSEGC